ncbi:DedA family protein [Auraticoccus sp. F435]|uniref:DedA family protein n=1 Tax=Auraticoccus cholistanensis TaxID=2656650 RepID=A0A6A9UUZ2_9ACTN|nr:DedA family protein [Auraticoccus cholistanensis]MVA76488.1 DedA family protein [Auraticoccus cholistanensis]
MPEPREAHPAEPERPDAPSAEPERPGARETTDGADGATDTPAEWWDDPRMPWKGKPGRWDLVCWFGIMFMGVFALVMIPLRAYLVVANPVLQAALTGSRSALVVLGVTDHPLWGLGLVLGILSYLKFEWVYFLAGRLWGRGLIDMMLQGRSRRTERMVDRLEGLARRYGVPALVFSYLPLPLPTWVVTPAVAIAGMRWRTWWITSILCAVVLQCGWVALGFWLGEPARVVVEAYARISGYVAIGLVVVVLVTVFLRQSRQSRAAARS